MDARGLERIGYAACLAMVLAVASAWLAVSQPAPSVRWLVKEDMSEGWDTGFGACVAGDYVYIVGNSAPGGDKEFRIEMRDRASGELVKAWAYNPSEGKDLLHDCLVIGDKLYVVGADEKPGNSEWILLVFDLDLNPIANVTSNPSDELDYAQSITSDGEYLYIAGNAGGKWRIERRRLDLSLVKAYTYDPSKGVDFIRSIAINPATGELWAVGAASIAAKAELAWYIEIYDKDLNRVGKIEPDIKGAASSVAFDEEGYAYLVGENGIAKFDRRGGLVKVNREYNGSKAFYHGGYLYVASAVSPVAGPWTAPPRHALLIFDKDLNLVREVILSDEEGYFPIGKMGFDGESLFIAGNYKIAEGNAGWIVFSVTIAAPVAPKCKGRIEALRAIPGNRIAFGEPLEIEVSLSESGLFLTVVAYGKELGEEFVLFNSTAESEIVSVEGRSLPAGNYTIVAYLEGKTECKSEPLEIEILKSRPRLSLEVSEEEIAVGEEVLVEGRVEGFAERVYVNLTSPAGEVRTEVVELEDSSFSLRFKLEEPGTWSVVAYAPETANNYASTSNTVVVRVSEKAEELPAGLPPIGVALAVIVAVAVLALVVVLLRRRT